MMFMGVLVAGFILMAVLLNILLRVLAVKPVSRISAMADEVSLGNLDAPEVEWDSRDEIGALSMSFNRMRRSLESALRLLQDAPAARKVRGARAHAPTAVYPHRRCC